MGDLLELSSRVIDSGVADAPVNRVTEELSELADDLAIVEVRALLDWQRRAAERSVMSKGIYAAAARESEEVSRAARST